MRSLILFSLVLLSFQIDAHKCHQVYEEYTQDRVTYNFDPTVKAFQSAEKTKVHLESYLQNVRLDHVKTFVSGDLIHHTFIQVTNEGIPIYQTTVKIGLNQKRNEALYIAHLTYDLEDFQYDHVNAEIPIHTELVIASPSPIIALREGQFTSALHAVVKPVNDIQTLEVIWDEDGVIYQQDLNAYCPPQDSVVDVSVFDPDPLTTANSNYLPPFLDNGDNNTTALNGERVTREVVTTFDDGTGIFSLVNDVVRMQDFAGPSIAPPTSTTPNFDFGRGDDGFEDVNAFYHITHFHEYISSLGYGHLPGFQISVDAHAAASDNSFFSPSPPRLSFGEGGVDDAEDADVIVHEYAHALSHGANGQNSGSERRALDEGLGDYFAASYSREIDEYRWADVFTWDGHNEYWAGRSANTSKIYPDDLVTQIHKDGEIWASAMMEIWAEIGKEATDKLQLKSLEFYTNNMTLIDAGNILINVDDEIFNGQYFCRIYPILFARGLVPEMTHDCDKLDTSITVITGNDTSICFRDAVVLGSEDVNSTYTYQWTPEIYLSDPASSATNAFPTQSTLYTLRVETPLGFFNEKSVVVDVVYCDTEIRLTNSWGLANGDSYIELVFPEEADNHVVRVFDAIGKRITEVDQTDNRVVQLDALYIQRGVYFVQILNEEGKAVRTFKVLKR